MECQVIADDAQADLAVAMPALEKAMMEVDKLDKTAITEVCMSVAIDSAVSRYRHSNGFLGLGGLRAFRSGEELFYIRRVLGI